ncbi:MAG TPA: matrixin family metalloprotease, partial [Motilibacteraceae bacterium]|nr:matrixin family metalloprotease [Motilibacteraceae bacterium]
ATPAPAVPRHAGAAGAIGARTMSMPATGPYRFFAPTPAGPAHWDRCTPVPVFVRWTGAPPSFRADLTEALRRLAAASGLRFTVSPTTSLPLRPGSGADDVPGGIYIAWTTPRLVPQLAGPTASYTEPLWVPLPGREPQIVEAGVALDRTHTFRPGFAPNNGLGDLLLHELGHAVGLAHVSDPTQVMYPAVNAASTGRFGSGDLAGLRRLAAYPCFG